MAIPKNLKNEVRLNSLLVGNLTNSSILERNLKGYQGGVVATSHVRSLDSVKDARNYSLVFVGKNDPSSFVRNVNEVREKIPYAAVVGVDQCDIKRNENGYRVDGMIGSGYMQGLLYPMLDDLREQGKLYSRLGISIVGSGGFSQQLLYDLKNKPWVRNVDLYSESLNETNPDFVRSSLGMDLIREIVSLSQDGPVKEQTLVDMALRQKLTASDFVQLKGLEKLAREDRLEIHDSLAKWAKSTANNHLVLFATGPVRTDYNHIGGKGLENSEGRKLFERTYQKAQRVGVALEREGYGGLIVNLSNPVEALNLVFSEVAGFDRGKVVSFEPNPIRAEKIMLSYLPDSRKFKEVSVVGSHRKPLILYDKCILDSGNSILVDFPKIANSKSEITKALNNWGANTMRASRKLGGGDYTEAPEAVVAAIEDIASIKQPRGVSGYNCYVDSIGSFTTAPCSCNFPDLRFVPKIDFKKIKSPEIKKEIASQVQQTRELLSEYFR